METLKKIFLSPDEPRLRAGWRLAVQVGLWLAISLPLAIPGVFVLMLIPESFDVVNVVLNAVSFIGSVLLARRLIDRRSIKSLGLRVDRQAVRDLLVGIGIAGVQILVIYLIETQAGWLEFEGFAWQEIGWLDLIGGLIWWGLLFLAVGFYEELFSRGYQLQNLLEGLNVFWAVLLSSGFFGLIHLINPGATWKSTLGVAVAGAFFAFAYLRTRQLWLPIGMHIGWNFFEGPVYGFPVSGMETVRLLLHQATGPEMWTGGSFGPEAGLVVIPGLLVGLVLVYAYTRSRVIKQEAGEINDDR
jgi:membrane protease YdiL (CAAX protease family)